MNKLLLFSVFSILTLNVMAQEKIVQTAGRDQLGTFATKFAELNDDVLFGEVSRFTVFPPFPESQSASTSRVSDKK